MYVHEIQLILPHKVIIVFCSLEGSCSFLVVAICLPGLGIQTVVLGCGHLGQEAAHLVPVLCLDIHPSS